MVSEESERRHILPYAGIDVTKMMVKQEELGKVLVVGARYSVEGVVQDDWMAVQCSVNTDDNLPI